MMGTVADRHGLIGKRECTWNVSGELGKAGLEECEETVRVRLGLSREEMIGRASCRERVSIDV